MGACQPIRWAKTLADVGLRVNQKITSSTPVFNYFCVLFPSSFGVSTKIFSMSSTGCLSSNHNAVISAEMKGRKVYKKESGYGGRWTKNLR